MTSAGLEARSSSSPPELDDEEVVRRVCEGDTALFEALIRRYNQRLYRVARAILRNDGEAEDVMQQAYVNAYAHLGQFAGRAKFSTWLTRIAVHEALARVRRRARWLGMDPMSDADGEPGGSRDERPDPEARLHSIELSRLLESAIDRLPGIYRSVFLLREAEQLGTAEVAECLEISEDAVRTRFHRAKAHLRQYLYEQTGATGASAFSFHLSRCDGVVATVLGRLGASGAFRKTAGLEPGAGPSAMGGG
jgi:RNA polymerase sigma-70 factor (ECF subfamily)